MSLEKLLPLGNISSTETSTGYEFSATETEVTMEFITDVSASVFCLQIYWNNLDGDGIISLERSNDGVHWSDVVGDDGTAITFTITGTSNTTIFNLLCGFGYTRIIYANTDNAAGTIGANLQRGVNVSG